MISTPVALCVALLYVAVATTASALPSHWTSFYRPSELVRPQQQQLCLIEEVTIGCRSARLVLSNGHYSYVHVCPVDSSNPIKLCYNSKLPRCCPTDVGGPLLTCVTRTTLKFDNEVVEIEIHLNTTSGTHCIAFDDAHQDIESCCPIRGNELDNCRRNPPVCVPKRDIYFIVDSTDSIDDSIFCRFGYVLQLIVAAINPRGLDAARVGAILFRFGNDYDDMYLFNLDDQCGTIVSDNIPRVVYEYFAVKNLSLPRGSLTYPNVRATSTLPTSALYRAYSSIATVSKPLDRPTSVITLTDGKSHQEVTQAVDLLKTVSDPLIAAGIGLDVSVGDLNELASNSSTVVYEPDRDNAIAFGIRIVEIMRDTGALCADEAEDILASLNAATESNLDQYCARCMWRTESQKTESERQQCSSRRPTCGARNLIMQAFDDVPQQQGSKVVLSDWEMMMLRGEIEKAVEDVIAKIDG